MASVSARVGKAGNVGCAGSMLAMFGFGDTARVFNSTGVEDRASWLLCGCEAAVVCCGVLWGAVDGSGCVGEAMADGTQARWYFWAPWQVRGRWWVAMHNDGGDGGDGGEGGGGGDGGGGGVAVVWRWQWQ